MIDVIGAKAGADELLEQIGFFIAALGGAKTGQRIFAHGIANRCQRAARQIQRFFPRCLAKHIAPIFRVHIEVCRLGHTRFANQRLGEALFVVRIIEAVTTFHTQTIVIRRSVAALNSDDFIFFDVVCKLATYTAIRAHRINRFICFDLIGFFCRCQCTCWASLYTFTAGNTGGRAHRIILVKHNFGMRATKRVADHIVRLFFAARPDAAGALDARIQIHRHRGVREIRIGLKPWLETGFFHTQ